MKQVNLSTGKVYSCSFECYEGFPMTILEAFRGTLINNLKYRK